MEKNAPSVDPGAFLTSLAAMMAQLHEMYQAAIDAGFTERQAMAVVLETIRAGVAKAS